MVTLGWIQSTPSRWKTNVAHRVSEIQRLTNSIWNHVATYDNPADFISPGFNPGGLSTCDIWWNGPSWLSRPRKV